MIPGPATAGRGGKPVRKAVDVSTHRRAWKQRAGVVVALVVGALLTVPATPALAAPNVSVTPGSVSLNAGSDATVTVTVSPGEGDETAEISLAGLPSGVSCTRGCGEIRFPGGQPRPQLVVIRANDNAGNANTTVTVAAEGSASGAGTATFQLTVRAKAAPEPTQAQTVRSVSGKVVNQANGEAVPNAVVILQDASGKRFDTISDDNGNFRFSGSTSNPIAPGRLDIGASVGDVRAFKSLNASAGQSVSGQRLSLAIKTEATPSPTPSESAEALPTDEATEEGTEESADAAAAAPTNASNEDSGGIGSLLIILLGGLLVAAGVGTIVLLWMRRKENSDETEGGAGPAAAAGAVPAARGAYRGADDHTRVVNPAGAAPTMVGGAAVSDAPTMMHRPVVDDVPPDPYGVPQSYGTPAGQGGWAGNGYGDEPAGAGAYGTGAYGGAPSSGGGYGNAPSSGGGYGTPPSSGGGYGGNDYGAPAGAGYPPAPAGGPGYGERYDEPTGRYQGDATQYPAPADPYATGMYQQDPGYGQAEPASYGRGGEPTGGYDQRGGYDQGGYGQPGGYGQEPPAQRGGYDQGGYDQGGGYGGGGYGQPGGYDQGPPAQRGGYDQGGYDQGGGYGGGGYADPTQSGRARPDGPPQDRSGRRLDWLDD